MNELNNLNEKKKVNKNSDLNENLFEVESLKLGLLELNNLREILDYKDFRSVVNWCKKNKVFIIQHGNRQFVNEWQFTLSFYKPFIEYLKRENENWKELFLNYLNGEIGQLLNLNIDKTTVVNTSNYKPKSETQVSFLDKIKNI